MGRKSTIKKLPSDVKQYIDKLLRKDHLTIDELLESICADYPELENPPSRSALGRYKKGFEEIVQSQRQIETAANAIVAELGDEFDDKSGAFLAQAVTTLVANVTMHTLEKASGDIQVKDAVELARAAKYSQETRSLSRKERQTIAKDAREKLLREQTANLDKTAKAQGMSEEQVQFWKEKVLGIK